MDSISQAVGDISSQLIHFQLCDYTRENKFISAFWTFQIRTFSFFSLPVAQNDQCQGRAKEGSGTVPRSLHPTRTTSSNINRDNMTNARANVDPQKEINCYITSVWRKTEKIGQRSNIQCNVRFCGSLSNNIAFIKAVGYSKSENTNVSNKTIACIVMILLKLMVSWRSKEKCGLWSRLDGWWDKLRFSKSLIKYLCLILMFRWVPHWEWLLWK
jgi:hypothetical protein